MLKMPVPVVQSRVRKRDASTTTVPERPPSACLCSFFPALVTETLPRRRNALPDVMVATLRFRGGGSGGGLPRRSDASTPPANPCHCCTMCQPQGGMGCSCDPRPPGDGGTSAESEKVGCSCYDSDEPPAEPPGREQAVEEPTEEPIGEPMEEPRGSRRPQEIRDESPEEWNALRKSGITPGLEDSDDEPFVEPKRKTFAESKRKRDDFSDEDSFHELPRTTSAGPRGPPDENGDEDSFREPRRSRAASAARRDELDGESYPPRPSKPFAKGRDSGFYQGSFSTAKSRSTHEPYRGAPPPRALRASRAEDIPEEETSSDEPPEAISRGDSPPRSPGRALDGDDCRTCCVRRRPRDAWEERGSDDRVRSAAGGRRDTRNGREQRRRGSRDDISVGRVTRDFRRSLEDFPQEGESSDDMFEGKRTRSAYPGERRSSGDSSVSRRRSRGDSGERSRGFANERKSRVPFPDDRKSRAEYFDERKSRSDFPDGRRSRDGFLDERKSRAPFPDDRKSRAEYFDERKSRYDFPDDRRSRADILDERKSRGGFPDDRKSRADIYDERKSRADLYDDRRSRPDFLDERKSRSKFPDDRKSRADFSAGRRSSDFFDERRSRADFPDDRRSRAASPDVRRSRADFPEGRKSRGDFPGERSSDGGLGGVDRAGDRGRGSAGDMAPRQSKSRAALRDGCPPDCTGLPEKKSTKTDASKQSERGGKGEPCILQPKCHRDGVCPELAGISKCNEKQRGAVQPRSSTEASKRPTSGPGSSCSEPCNHTRGKKPKKKKRNCECCRKIFPCCVPREGESSKQTIDRSIREIPFRVRRVQPRGLARLVKR